MTQFFRTSEIAKIVGVHPNTVRLYEAKGFLPEVTRKPNNYRVYTETHLKHLQLAQIALKAPYLGSLQVVANVLKHAASGEFDKAQILARDLLHKIRDERASAEAAVKYLEQWMHEQEPISNPLQLTIGQAADYLDVTTDQLRNWDRSGLLDVPRDSETGYRQYSDAQIGRLRVIRMLRQSGYSVMAILRTLRQIDAGHTKNLHEILDTPGENEAIETIADRWLTTLSDMEQRTLKVIHQLTEMAQEVE